MDELSLDFARQSALRMVDACNDLEQLKQLTRSLVSGHFEAKALISHLMRENLRAHMQEPPDSAPQAPTN